MGMSASQARYLGLIARQNDLEYQGQQINQERTILSQQVTDLYNMLQNLNVPTPPSTSDFTSVEYTGNLGASKYSFKAEDVKPGSKPNTYNITLSTTARGDSLVRNMGYSKTNQGYESVKGTTYPANKTVTQEYTYYTIGNATESTPENQRFMWVKEKPTSGDYYFSDNGKIVKATPDNPGDNEDGYYVPAPEGTPIENCVTLNPQTGKKDVSVPNTITKEQITTLGITADNIYVINDDGTIKKATPNEDFRINDDGSITFLKNCFIKGAGNESKNLKSGNGEAITIDGNEAMTLEEAEKSGKITKSDKERYEKAIRNLGLTDTEGNDYPPDAFLIFIDGSGNVQFALKSDVTDNNTCVTYSYDPLGEYTQREPKKDCEIDFDPETGRILAIRYPETTDEKTGEVTSWITIKFEAKTVTDELAYQDAFNDYEYDKYLYDREQQEINHKTEIIQQQDKKLELKLQRLDNERTQIKTEIDAVKTVIKDNIEGSYKTFSG